MGPGGATISGVVTSTILAVSSDLLLLANTDWIANTDGVRVDGSGARGQGMGRRWES